MNMTLFVWHIQSVGLFSFRSYRVAVPRTVHSCGWPAWFTHQRAAEITAVPAASSREQRADFLWPDTGRGLCPLTWEPFKHYSSNLRLKSVSCMADIHCVYVRESELRFLNLSSDWVRCIFCILQTLPRRALRNAALSNNAKWWEVALKKFQLHLPAKTIVYIFISDCIVCNINCALIFQNIFGMGTH